MDRRPSSLKAATGFSVLIGQPSLVLLALVLTVSCSPSADPGSEIIATYRGGTVTTDDLDRWLSLRNLTDRPYDLRHEIDQMILTRSFAESARVTGLDRDPEVVRNLELVETAALERAYYRHLAESVTVNEREVDALQASDPDAFSRPRRVRLFNLYKRFPPGASSDERSRMRRRMEELRQTLIAGADFSKTALAESDSETRYRGGRMGTFEEGELPPAIDAVVWSLASGEISEVLETSEGLTILKCGGVFDAETPDATEARSMIMTNLLRIRRRTEVEDYREKTLASSGLSIESDRALDPACAPDEVIATFSGHEVSRAQLTTLLGARQSTKRHGPVTERQIRGVLETYAVTTLTAERARELGLDTDALRTEIQVRQELVLATEELGKSVRARFEEPTREEIFDFFTTHRSEFQHPEELDLMVIEMTFAEDTLTEGHAQARKALDALMSGSMSFEEAVRRYSEVPAPDGTPVMTLTTRQLASYGAAVGNAVRTMRPGEISGLIRQDNRLLIVKLVDRRPPRQLDFEAAEHRARNRLGQIRADEITAQIEAEVLGEARVQLAKE